MGDIGIYFGTFAPCHVGHYEQIVRAKRENKQALVIVSGYAGDRGDLMGMALANRVKAMRELLREEENVEVAILDETHIPRYPDGWQPWLDMVHQLIETEMVRFDGDVHSITFYAGEIEYMEPVKAYFEALWPKKNIVLVHVDRKITGISGTSIRENPLLNWDYVTRPFRRFFVRNVLVTGTAGSGKTSLVKDLARRYSTSFSLEFNKEYQIDHQVLDDELDIKDLHEIGIGQFELNRHHIHSPGTRKVFFADTDVMTAKVYAKQYLTAADYQTLASVFDFYINLQGWSLILLLPPVRQADQSDAAYEMNLSMHQMLIDEIESAGLLDKLHIMEGDFQSQFLAAQHLVNEILADGKDT